MHDYLAAILGLLALVGFTAFAVINEITIVNDVLAGFGLGSLAGTAIAVARERHGSRTRAYYTVMVSGLVGAASAVLIYIVVGLR